jgi:hypothetical protein
LQEQTIIEFNNGVSNHLAAHEVEYPSDV